MSNMNSIQHEYDLLVKTVGRKVVSSEADSIVATIEAFPRSANSYLVATVEGLMSSAGMVSSRNVLLHHTHRVETLLFSLSAGIPTISVVREPIDVIKSCFIFYGRSQSLSHIAKRYCDFYSSMLKHDQFESAGFLLLKFEDVVQEINKCVELINKRFGWGLGSIPDTEGHNHGVFSQANRRAKERHGERLFVEKVGAPSKQRDEMKMRLHESVVDLPELEGCTSLYGEVVNKFCGY